MLLDEGPSFFIFFNKNLINFALLSSETIGSPSKTTKVSSPSSSRTSNSAFKSAHKQQLLVQLLQLGSFLEWDVCGHA